MRLKIILFDQKITLKDAQIRQKQYILTSQNMPFLGSMLKKLRKLRSSFKRLHCVKRLTLSKEKIIVLHCDAKYLPKMHCMNYKDKKMKERLFREREKAKTNFSTLLSLKANFKKKIHFYYFSTLCKNSNHKNLVLQIRYLICTKYSRRF